MRRIGTKTAILLCCCFLLGCKKSIEAEVSPAEYAVMKITPQAKTITMNYPATIQGRQDIAIYPQVSGTISQVCIKEGENVKKGQILFIIDQVPYKAALQVAEANVQAAQASVANAQLLYNSKQVLRQEEVISDFDMSTAYNQLLSAKAQLAQAEAQAVNARNSLSYTTVKSPSDGVTGTLPFRVGALVSPSIPQALTTISDNSDMFVYFSLTETQLLNLSYQYGSMKEALTSLPKVRLKLSNNELYSHEGFIESISGVVDPSTGSVSVRAVFPNQGGLLHSGSSGSILLAENKSTCIVIPRSATFETQDKVFVYKIVDGKAVSQMIEKENIDGGQEYIVTNGLQSGDEIVTEGVGMLKEGTPIVKKQTTNKE